jgi:hypothetical protein
VGSPFSIYIKTLLDLLICIVYFALRRINKFRKDLMKSHDRYLIYSILGRSVDIKLPLRQGGDRLLGVVEKITRDIFDNGINVTISGKNHVFQEPSAIIDLDGDIHLIYGDIDIETFTNFHMPSYNAYDESLHEHLKRTERCPVSETVIKVGDVKRTPRNRWRSRVAV